MVPGHGAAPIPKRIPLAFCHLRKPRVHLNKDNERDETQYCIVVKQQQQQKKFFEGTCPEKNKEEKQLNYHIQMMAERTVGVT